MPTEPGGNREGHDPRGDEAPLLQGEPEPSERGGRVRILEGVNDDGSRFVANPMLNPEALLPAEPPAPRGRERGLTNVGTAARDNVPDANECRAAAMSIESRSRAGTQFRLGGMFSKHSMYVPANTVHSREDVIDRFMFGGMFNPHYPAYVTYVSVIESVGIMHALYTAYDMGFGPFREAGWLVAIDCVIDAMFGCEMYVQSRTAQYLSSTDVYVADMGAAWRRFCSKKALSRLLHITPVQLLHYALYPALLTVGQARPLKVLRGFKLLRLKSIFMETEKQIAMRTKHDWRKQMFLVVLRFLIVSHIIACVVQGLTFMDETDERYSWIAHMCGQWDLDPGCEDDKSPSWMYLVCMYYATTIITTVGFGNQMPYSEIQLIAHTIAVALGACHNALLISSIMNVFDEYNQQRRDYRRARIDLDNFLASRQLSEELANEVKQHFDYQWSVTRYVNDQEFMSRCLSNEIRMKVLREMYMESVKACPLLRDVPVALLSLLLEAGACEHFKKDDVVCKRGHFGSRVYIVVDGSLHAHVGRRRKTMRKGQVFGHTILIDVCTAYSETVIAKSSTTTLGLDRSRMEKILSMHGGWWERVRERVCEEYGERPAPVANREWADIARSAGVAAAAARAL